MAQGEEAAFTAFHAAYFPRLFRYALVLMRGDEHAARDVTQEALLRVVRYVRVFESEETFWHWLTRLTRTAAADHGRRSSRYQRLLSVLRLGASAEQEAPASGEMEAAMAGALSQIPLEDADLLTRRYHDAMTNRELAAHFKLTEEAVESRLVRARKVLRQTAFRLLNHDKP